ncbi:MAG: ABC-2 family transporter protein [Anaerolineae bacterium]|nr:ABC-2 family transporter protein [Anaerolineae bacterium]
MKTFRLVGAYMRHNLMSAMAYREAFILQAFGMLINNLMLLVFWAVLFSRFPNLNGWNLQGVVTLYGILATGFGIAGVIFGNSGRVAQMIADGDLDYFLALPADPLVHILVSRSSLSAWGDLIFGVLVYLVANPVHWIRLPLFFLLSVFSALVFVAFGTLTGSLAFWLGQSQNLSMQMRNALITFGLYPVDIFPGAVRLLLYTIIPAAFVASLPAALLTNFSIGRFLGITGFTIAVVLLARWVFSQGLRQYGSGNLVTTRG